MSAAPQYYPCLEDDLRVAWVNYLVYGIFTYYYTFLNILHKVTLNIYCRPG